MAYDATNKRVYIDTSVTPNVGVSIADVKTCLSESSNDLGTLCTSNSIKKWAKNKPIRFNTIGILTQSQREDAFWGLGEPEEHETAGQTAGAQLDAFRSAATDEHGHAFEYLKPTGTIGVAPYRLLDFDGYYHNSPCPIIGHNIATINIAEVSGSMLTFNVQKNNDTIGAISLADVFTRLGLSNYYLAIGFNRGGVFFYRTSSDTIGTWAANPYNGALSVVFNITDYPFSGTAENVPFYIVAASGKYTIDDSLFPTSQYFRALPFNTKSDGYGSISIQNFLPLRYEMLRIGEMNPSTSLRFNSYTDASNYIVPTGGGDNYYELATGTGSFAYGVKITYNGTKDSFILYRSRLAIASGINAYDWQNGTGTRSLTSLFYTTSESGSLISVGSNGYITIQRGTPVYVIMYVQNFLGLINGSAITHNVSEGQARAPFYLYYDGVERWEDNRPYVNIRYNANQ